MVFFRKYRDTLVQLRRNIPFLREKIKQSEGIRKKWMYMTLLWQSVLAIVILVTSVVGTVVVITINWIVSGSDGDLVMNILGSFIVFLFLFVFLMWSLFILRKVFPKMQENMIRRLEGED